MKRANAKHLAQAIQRILRVPFPSLAIYEQHAAGLHIDGLTYEEIAEQMGVSKSMVGYYIGDACRHLGVKRPSELAKHVFTRIANVCKELA